MQEQHQQSAEPLPSLYVHPSLRHAFSAVVPCHNEEMNIIPLVSGLKASYRDYLWEIILVDDNSQDRTGEVIRALAETDPLIRPIYRTPPNGVGRAITEGLRAATGKYILTIDCDFQPILPELEAMFEAAAQGYDVVIGSRFSRQSTLVNYPFLKKVANRGFHLLAQLMLGRSFNDLTNNLKILRRPVVEALSLTQPGFAVNAETGLQPLLMGYSVKEIPVSWINRSPEMGTSSFNLMRSGLGYWQVLLSLCQQTRFGNQPLRNSSK